jgi:4-amino-4-deoxy-L-arabinose transferase-like glycosyltransferase
VKTRPSPGIPRIAAPAGPAVTIEPWWPVPSVSSVYANGPASPAASYQLATGKPVMAIGGFNGSDPSPTLAQFKQYVAQGKIHYFIGAGGQGGGQGGGETRMGPGGGTSSEISTWVAATFAQVTLDGVTFYDLTERK